MLSTEGQLTLEVVVVDIIGIIVVLSTEGQLTLEVVVVDIIGIIVVCCQQKGNSH